MAPERRAHNSTPNTVSRVKEEVVEEEGPPTQRHSSILEDFLEYKIKEELEYGGGDPLKSKKEVDEDLTSLTWLQNNNLLKSKPLTLPEAGKVKIKHEESPTSDLTAEETASDSSSGHSAHSARSSHSQSRRQSLRSPVLLMDRNTGSMTEAPEPRRIEPAKSLGKEKHQYSVTYDPKVHVSSKPPYSFSCLIFMAIEDSHARALPVKDIYLWITDHFPYFLKAPTGWKNSVRHNLSLNKCFRKVDKAPNLGKGSLWIVDPQYRANLLNALSKAPYHPCASLDRPAKPPILPANTLTPQQQQFIAMKSQSRLPNPELFPYLSRRLAASEADRMNEADESDEDSLDDVDAAAAILELKHGQKGSPGSSRRYRWDNLIPLISTSPSEDHTYSAEQTRLKRLSVSPDEAYVGGSDSNDDNSRPFAPRKSLLLGREEDSWSSDGAEQRNVASALLNLAGGSRKRAAEPYPPVHSKRTHRVKRSHHRPSILQRSKKHVTKHADSRAEHVTNNNTDKLSGRGGAASGKTPGTSNAKSRYNGK